MEVVIVGAGIGGLAAAHFLGRGGHRVTVVEEAGRLRTSGAAVSLWFNGADQRVRNLPAGREQHPLGGRHAD